MKTLIVAAMLLALTSPAFAAKAKPQDFSDIRKWVDLNWQCNYSVFPPDDDEDERSPRGKACTAANKLEKKLAAKGYCTYGHGSVGKAGNKYFYPGIDSAGTNSGMARHCYTITNLPERLD